MKARKTALVVGLVAMAAALVACGDDDDDGDGAAPDETTAETTGDTTGDTTGGGGDAECPSTLTIQTDWFPELEHGGTYQLIGTEGEISKDNVNYSGPVQEQYAVPGLETIVINTVKFDKADSAILLDGEADMAYINMSDVIKDSAAVDMVVVAKTLELDPQMVMWDPAQFDITKPEDIAATGAPVLHFPGTAYIDYMTGKGYMTADQDDPTYDGSDAKFVSSNGGVFQQGFATNEVYKYENEIAWKDGAPAPVEYYTVGQMGFNNYAATLAMMKDRVAELDGCLTALIPKMQQAWIDFVNDPQPIMDKMIEINQVHDGFWGLSPEVNAAGFELLTTGGFVDNSMDGTYCSIDPARVQELYDILKPIYDDQGVEITDDPTSIYTNKYCEGAPGM